MNKQKFRKLILILVAAIVIVFVSYPVFVYEKFSYAESHSSVSKVLHHPNTLTIIYRRGCHRCLRILPRLLLKHGLENKPMYVLNADRLSLMDQDKLNIRVTPVFRLNNHSFNTVKEKNIVKVWNDAK